MFEAQLHQSKFQQIPSHAVSLSHFFFLLSPPTQLPFLVFQTRYENSEQEKWLSVNTLFRHSGGCVWLQPPGFLCEKWLLTFLESH